MIDLPGPLAVVCHDAGAANLILPWLDDRADLLPVMQGPAAQLWRARFGNTPTFDPQDALDGAASVLTGTGWASDVEHQARKMARERGLHSVAVIDHWVNYPERFVREHERVLPDEICVTDAEALDIAEKAFPGLRLRLMPNRYLEEQVARAPPLDAGDDAVLFVAEPVQSTWGRDGPGEFQALDYFLERRQAAGIPREAAIRLRPHPSDPPGKYSEWLAVHPRVRPDDSPSLAAAFQGVRWVVGCESYALVVAFHSGREAISALPPWAPPCRLPQKQIRRLSAIDLP